MFFFLSNQYNDETLAKLSKEIKERRQITNIKKERRDSKTHAMDFKMIVMEYFKQLFAYKFNNLDKMNQFLERCKLSKLTEAKMDNLNRYTLNKLDQI